MGYDLHITLGENWWGDNPTDQVSLEQWLGYVSSDPEMRRDSAAEAALPDGSFLRYENPGLAVWTAYSGHGVGGSIAWFDHQHGCIVVKNPDEEIRRKMCAIAEAMGARVQGDDGEYYEGGIAI